MEESIPSIEGPGSVIGNYRIIESIGEGGFGTVYRAEQTVPVQRHVALKIIKLGMDTKQVVARFEAERQAMAMMSHPSIAKVHDAGVTSTGRPYFVMELVPGLPLTEFADQEALSTDERLELFRNVCLAVQHAHQKGILHRDLKPSNVLVAQVDGAPLPKVIDFGIAKALEKPLTDSSLATGEFQVIGTPEYMPPEQAAGRDVDTRADVYALGVLLYELLTGTLPFKLEGTGIHELGDLLRHIREVTPAKPSSRVSGLGEKLPDVARFRRTPPTGLIKGLRGDLDWIVMKALEKDRDRRYATATELAEDIAHHLAHEPVHAGPPSNAYRVRKFVCRHRVFVFAFSAVAAALLAAAGALVWGFVRVSDERDLAREAQTGEKEAREEVELALEETDRARNEEAAARIAEAAARVEAEESLEESDAVTTFLEEMLASLDPRRDGRGVTVRELLDRSAGQVATDFASKPRIRSRIARTIGAAYRNLGLLDESEPHLESALAIARVTFEPDDRQLVHAASQLSRLRVKQMRLDECEPLILECVAALERTHGPSKELAQLLNNLGHLYTLCGRTEEAEERLQESLEMMTAAVGEEHEKTISVLVNLSVLYGDLDRYVERDELAEQIFESRLRDLGPEHYDTLLARSNRIEGLRARGRHEEALEENRAILDVRRRVLGDDHPGTIDSMGNLAWDLSVVGRYAESEELYREVIAVRRRDLGERHPELGETLRALGLVLWHAGRNDEAEPVLEEALDILAGELGSTHPETLDARNVLGIVHYTLGRYEKALSSWRALHERYLAVGEEESSSSLIARQNIAMVLADLGRFDEAEAGYLEVLEAFRELQGPEAKMVQFTLNNLAILYMDTGRLDEAEAMNEELLEIRERRLGSENPYTLGTWNNLAIVYTMQGRYEEAVTLHEELLERRVEALGPAHADVADSMVGLAQNLASLGRDEDAVDLYREAIDMQVESLGSGAPEVLVNRYLLASTLLELGEPEEAEQLLIESLDRQSALLGEDHPDTLDTAGTLAELYTETDRLEEARPLFETMLESRRRAARAPGAPATAMWACAALLLACESNELGDSEEALELALAADERTGHSVPRYLGTLARAYAATGDSKRAAEAARAAIDRLPESAPFRKELEPLLR